MKQKINAFERRGREGFAEGAEKKYKRNFIFLFFGFLLRILRNLRDLCVQKLNLGNP
jgi:hypothetical protein